MHKNDRVLFLEKNIIEASNDYYNTSTPLVSDDVFDLWVSELKKIDPTNLVLSKIGADPTTEWIKEKHLYPLGSLNKVNTPDDMTKWVDETLNNNSIVVIDKLDGLSIGCQYENGRLTKAILRGGGYEGEDIYSNVVKMHGVIKNIPDFTGVLRGEIILTKANHVKYFSDKANPRNAASGICRRLDGEGSEYLAVMFYQVFGKDFNTEIDQLNFIEKCGCLVPKYWLCQTSDEVNKLWQAYQDSIRQSLDYEIDGLVVYCNNIAFQQELGAVNLRPKGKLAFKFANQFVKTIVKQIVWITGGSGRVTPVCYVDPVNLLGSIVEKASVYNIGYIEKLGLDIGAEVLICKAGEIIPRIESVVIGTNTINKYPDNCSICGSKLAIEGEYLVCPNVMTCPAQVSGRIKNWINTLNIKEWGVALVDRLLEANKIKTIVDLYHLTVEDLASLPRMGNKSAQKAYNILWDNNNIKLEQFLGGLSIPMIGETIIGLVMNAGYDNLNKIMDASKSDFENIKGIGESKAESLFTGLINNKHIIAGLLGSGIKIKEKIKGAFTGRVFVFTGEMDHDRNELTSFVIENGGVVKNSVGKACNYLVIADPNSQTVKAKSARSLGVKLISEKELFDMAEGR